MIPTTSEEIAGLIDAAPRADAATRKAADARQASLTKPPGSLGRLEEIALFMAGWQARSVPRIDRAQALIFAGNHGVCAHGINPYPQSVTAQMVTNFETGGAAINQLCAQAGAQLSVIALRLDMPSADFTQGRALDPADVDEALQTGWDAVDRAGDILLLGEMGIGNSTIAAALCAALLGGRGSDWAGPGSGSDAQGLARKIAVIDQGLARHQTRDPHALLAAFGGREQAALLGAILAARQAGIPVLLDGFITCAAALIAHAIRPAGLDHCLIAHRSAEPGHGRLCAALGKAPLLDLGLRLGEGSGAALALNLVRAALACHAGMATFQEAQIDDRTPA